MDTYINKIDQNNITSLIIGGVIEQLLHTGVVFDLGSGKATFYERK